MTRDHVILFAAALIWGSTIPLSNELFTRITPVEFLRYPFALVPAVLVWSLSGKKPRQTAPRSEGLPFPGIVSHLAVAGILAATLRVYTVGIDLSSSAFAGLTLALVPVVVALIEVGSLGIALF